MTTSILIQEIESEQLKKDIPNLRIGDTLNVHLRIVEGDKERLQVFTGTMISRKGSGLSQTISLYKFSYGTGVERVFNINSPKIAKIEVVRSGKARKSKLYFLRGTSGKASKLQEDIGIRKED